QRPMFIRATNSSDESSSSHTLPDESATAAAEDRNDTTPLARPNEHKASDLVDTLESRSSLFDRISFSWANDLLGKGSRRRLQYSDLYRLDQANMPVTNWRRYLRHRKPGRSLFVAMAITFAPEFLVQAVLSIIVSILRFGGPFFLQRILRAIELTSDESSPSTTNFRKSCLDALGLPLIILIGNLCGNQTLWTGRNIGIRLKGLLVAELSAKTLCRRGKGSWNEEKVTDQENPENDTGGSGTAAADGKIMNLLTADFQRVMEGSVYLDQLYAMPLSLAIGIWYMYHMLGVSALVGLLIAVLYAPMTKVMFTQLTALEMKRNA
ncbi:hypothetical protein LPJ59_007159, partial [Coemansia sp. RSA 2399]